MKKRLLALCLLLLVMMLGCAAASAEDTTITSADGLWDYTSNGSSATLVNWHGTGTIIEVPTSVDNLEVDNYFLHELMEHHQEITGLIIHFRNYLIPPYLGSCPNLQTMTLVLDNLETEGMPVMEFGGSGTLPSLTEISIEVPKFDSSLIDYACSLLAQDEGTISFTLNCCGYHFNIEVTGYNYNYPRVTLTGIDNLSADLTLPYYQGMRYSEAVASSISAIVTDLHVESLDQLTGLQLSENARLHYGQMVLRSSEDGYILTGLSTSYSHLSLPEALVVGIDEGVFAGAPNLTDLYLSEALFSQPELLPEGINLHCYSNRYATLTREGEDFVLTGFSTNEASPVIPEVVTILGEGAMGGTSSVPNTKLTSVTLPASVREVRSSAFAWCTKLTTADLAGVQILGDHAFQGCSVLTSVTMDSCQSVGGCAFDGCSKLTAADLPVCETVGSSAFYNCKSLARVSLPQCLSIGQSAFYDCTALTSVSLPLCETVSGFYGCTNLTTVEIPGCTSLGSEAFARCSSLTELNLPLCTSIGANAFSGCTNLTEVALPQCVSLNENAFSNCISLASIDLPSCTFAADTAFSGCSGLAFANLPKLGSQPNYTFFRGCTSLEKVIISGSSAFSIASDVPALTVETVDSAFPSGMTFSFRIGDTVLLPEKATLVKTAATQWSLTAEEKDIWDSLPGTQKAAWGDFLLCKSNVNYVVGNNPDAVSLRIPDGTILIAGDAFKNYTSLRSVQIPETVTNFGSYAFSGCTALETADIASTGEVLIDYAFQNCPNLTLTVHGTVASSYYGSTIGCEGCTIVLADGADIPKPSCLVSGVRVVCGSMRMIWENNSMTLEEGCALNLADLRSFAVSDGAMNYVRNGEDIQVSARDTGLTAYHIPEDVTLIPYHGFYSCSASAEFHLPSTVTKIQSYAFPYGATVALPDNVVEFVSSSATFICGVETVTARTVSASTEFYDPAGSRWRWLFDEEGRETGLRLIKGSPDMTEIVLPDPTTEISSYAFLDNTSLTSVTLNAQLKLIGLDAFRNCSSLAAVSIPSGVTVLPDRAFYSCSSLASVSLPEALESIGESAFYGCSTLPSIHIPDSVKSIGKSAFMSCSALASVTGLGSVETVGANAFYITSSDAPFLDLYLPETCVAGQNTTYSGKSRLHAPVGSPLAMSAMSFYDDVSKSQMKYETVSGNKRLTLVKTDTDQKAVVIPEGVQYISSSAFRACPSMTSLTLPQSLVSISSDAFSGCTGLAEVTLPDHITSFGYSAFPFNTVIHANLQSQTARTVSPSRPILQDGLFYAWLTKGDASRLCLVGAAEGISEISPAAGTEWIAASSMEYIEAYHLGLQENAALKKADLPDSVIGMDSYAFDGCTGLGEVSLPGSLSSVPPYAFRGCTALTALSLPDGITEIGKNAFEQCSSLKNVSFGSSLGTICPYAFRACTSLETISASDSLVSIGDYAFYDCSALKSAPLQNGLTSISNNAFSKCLALESIVLPDSLETLGSSAFSGCSSLKSVFIGNGLTEISRYAFSSCTSLEDVRFSEGLETIGERAFDSCPLSSLVLPDSLKAIMDYAFRSGRFAAVCLSQNLEMIGSNAFSSALTTVYTWHDCPADTWTESNWQLKVIYLEGDDTISASSIVINQNNPLRDTYLFAPFTKVEYFNNRELGPDGKRLTGFAVMPGYTFDIRQLAAAAPQTLAQPLNLDFAFADPDMVRVDGYKVTFIKSGETTCTFSVRENPSAARTVVFRSVETVSGFTVPERMLLIGGSSSIAYFPLSIPDTGMFSYAVQVQNPQISSFYDSSWSCISSGSGIPCHIFTNELNKRSNSVTFIMDTGLGGYIVRTMEVQVVHEEDVENLQLVPSRSVLLAPAWVSLQAYGVTDGVRLPLLYDMYNAVSSGNLDLEFRETINAYIWQTATVTITVGSLSASATVTLGDSLPEALTLPASMKEIGSEAFAGSGASRILIPDGVTLIGSKAFAGSSSLRLVEIPASVTSLAPDAFTGCSDLTVVLPEGAPASLRQSVEALTGVDGLIVE